MGVGISSSGTHVAKAGSRSDGGDGVNCRPLKEHLCGETAKNKETCFQSSPATLPKRCIAV